VVAVDEDEAPDAARDTRRARDTAAAAKQGRETMEADMTESASSSSAVEEWRAEEVADDDDYHCPSSKSLRVFCGAIAIRMRCQLH
jgi:hypothetical protein